MKTGGRCFCVSAPRLSICWWLGFLRSSMRISGFFEDALLRRGDICRHSFICILYLLPRLQSIKTYGLSVLRFSRPKVTVRMALGVKGNLPDADWSHSWCRRGRGAGIVSSASPGSVVSACSRLTSPSPEFSRWHSWHVTRMLGRRLSVRRSQDYPVKLPFKSHLLFFWASIPHHLNDRFSARIPVTFRCWGRWRFSARPCDHHFLFLLCDYGYVRKMLPLFRQGF